MTIGVDLLQTLSMFSSFSFAWPYTLHAILDAASVSTFAIELVAPECTLTFTFSEKWYAMQMFPPMMFCVLSTGIIVSQMAPPLLKRMWCTSCARSDRPWTGAEWQRSGWGDVKKAWGDAWDAVTAAFFTLLYYSYFMVVRRALEIFACTQYDGKWTLNSDPSLTCWVGVHARVVPYAALSLGVYGLGIPLAFGYVFWRHKNAIKRDQELWLLGRAPELLDTAHVRRRYSKLYQVC